jgi:hypothetical protein
MIDDVVRKLELKRIADFNDVIVHDFLIGTFQSVLDWIYYHSMTDIQDEVFTCFGKLVKLDQEIILDLKTWKMYDIKKNEIKSELKVLDDWYIETQSIIDVDYDAYPDFEKPEVDNSSNMLIQKQNKTI